MDTKIIWNIQTMYLVKHFYDAHLSVKSQYKSQSVGT